MIRACRDRGPIIAALPRPRKTPIERPMNEQERHNLFAELSNRHQGALYGYIYSVVRNWADTDDLYQSVCLILWRRFDVYRPGTSFFAWARQTARNQIGDFIRRKRAPRYVTEELLDILTEIAAEPYDADTEAYLAALQRCRQKLDTTDKELLRLRYVEELNSTQIADRLHRLRPSISRSLNRIRRLLFKCMETELAEQEYTSGELG
jgi:RNA polymerase sigma-70 factor, ECF subfamily